MCACCAPLMGLVRQASRGQGKQKRHACSGCGSKSHRLETCRAFAANKLRALLKKVASLKEASKTAVRKELKFRNSPHSSGSFKKNATAKYKAKKLQEVVRSPSAAEVRRRKPSAMPTDTCSTHEEAASWLLQNKFARKPRRCPGCKGSIVGAQVDSELHALAMPQDWLWKPRSVECELHLPGSSVSSAGAVAHALRLRAARLVLSSSCCRRGTACQSRSVQSQPLLVRSQTRRSRRHVRALPECCSLRESGGGTRAVMSVHPTLNPESYTLNPKPLNPKPLTPEPFTVIRKYFRWMRPASANFMCEAAMYTMLHRLRSSTRKWPRRSSQCPKVSWHMCQSWEFASVLDLPTSGLGTLFLLFPSPDRRPSRPSRLPFCHTPITVALTQL